MGSVKYEDFEIYIKRYGYVGSITDEILAEIADSINLNAEDLQDETSQYHTYYQAKCIFENGRYNT